jgi:hypothetical protein
VRGGVGGGEGRRRQGWGVKGEGRRREGVGGGGEERREMCED